MNKSYSELIQLHSFEDRFRYLNLNGTIADKTFGSMRWLAQKFYKSKEWEDIRNYVITRDSGCDLALINRTIFGKPIVHHMNPITIQDVEERNSIAFDPEFLITVSHNTHNAIHYGSVECLTLDPIIRRPNDTCPWKEGS